MSYPKIERHRSRTAIQGARSTYSRRTLEAIKLVQARARDILDVVVPVQDDDPAIDHGDLERAAGVLLSRISIFCAEEHLRSHTRA
jgi:hypothetical protein